MNAESKVSAEHLKRAAYLYIRQSTLRQVLENTESTQRQYALRRRALVLGWPEERIGVIDEGQGQSGASTNGRGGFLVIIVNPTFEIRLWRWIGTGLGRSEYCCQKLSFGIVDC